MNQKLNREQLAEGVFFSSVRDEKFRHNSISVNFIVPLEEETAACTAVIPSLLRRGSKNCPDFTRLEQALCDLYGASLSSDVTRSGEYQILTSSITFVDDQYTLNEEKISGQCAKLLGDMVLEPNIVDGAFPEEDFLLERQNLVDTIEAEINEKRIYAINQCMALMNEGTPLAVPKYGTVEQAKKLTSQMAARRYAQMVDTARVEIMFVGCGDPALAREQFRELWQGRERHPLVHTPAPAVERAQRIKEGKKELEIAQSKMVLGFRTGSIPGRRERTAMKLMSALYGGTPFSRLFLNVREKLSLCYYCAARFDGATGIMMVDIGLEKGNKDKAKEEILRQLSLVAQGEFDGEELENTKLSYINSLKSVGDSLAAIESWYLMQILWYEQPASTEQEVEAVQAVTREQVIGAASQVTLDTVYFLTSKEDSHEE